METQMTAMQTHIFGTGGGDGLETRLHTHIEVRAEHKKRSIMETIDNWREIQRMDREEDKTANHMRDKKVDRLTWYIAIGVGIIITMNALGLGVIGYLASARPSH